MTVAPSRLQSGLIILCCLLTAGIGYELYAPLPNLSVPAVTLRDPPPEAPVAMYFTAPPLESFATINERPMCVPGRKPVAPKSLGPAAPPPPPPSVALVGVIIDAAGRLALVKSSASPLEVSVGIGGSVDGWQVTRIEPDRIVLSLGATNDEIKLESNKAPSAQAATSATSTAPAALQATDVPSPVPTGLGSSTVAPGQTQMHPQSGIAPGVSTAPTSAATQMLQKTLPNPTDKQN